MSHFSSVTIQAHAVPIPAAEAAAFVTLTPLVRVTAYRIMFAVFKWLQLGCRLLVQWYLPHDLLWVSLCL